MRDWAAPRDAFGARVFWTLLLACSRGDTAAGLAAQDWLEEHDEIDPAGLLEMTRTGRLDEVFRRRGPAARAAWEEDVMRLMGMHHTPEEEIIVPRLFDDHTH